MKLNRDANGEAIQASTDWRIQHAIDVIYEQYGDIVSVNDKKKDLLKFGRNEALSGTEATIMTFAGSEVAETFVTDNDITHFASADSADQSIPLVVEGHTLSGGNLTFVTQTVTTNASDGQTKTALTTPLARVTRVYNNGASDLVGPVYVAEDVTFTAGVPQTNSAIHAIIPAGQNQTRKASTSLASTDYWIITGFTISCLEKAAAFVSAFIESRQLGYVFRPKTEEIAVSSSTGSFFQPFDPYIIIPKNSDVRIQAFANTTSIDGTAGVQGYLATVVS